MTQKEINRFKHLSEKVINQNAAPAEVVEFTHLLKEWNQSIEYNLDNRVRLRRVISRPQG